MENAKKDINSITQKDWINYIDKLITRENSKYNRFGITSWVLIAAVFYFIIGIVNTMGRIQLDVNNIQLKYLTWIISLLFLAVLSLINLFSDSINRKTTFSCNSDKKRIEMLVIMGLIAGYVLAYPPKGIPFIFVLLISIYFFIYLLFFFSNIQFYYNYRYNTFLIILFRLAKKFYTIKKQVIIINIILSLFTCVFLYFEIDKFDLEIFMCSVYFVSVLVLLFIFLYQIIGDFKLKSLKKIELKLILNEYNSIAEIKEDYVNEIEGMSLKEQLKDVKDSLGFNSIGKDQRKSDRLSSIQNKENIERIEDNEIEQIKYLNLEYFSLISGENLKVKEIRKSLRTLRLKRIDYKRNYVE